jgi:hypothetical protein
MRASPITVREPGLRPCRAFVMCVGNRGGDGWNFASAVGNGLDRSAKRTGLRRAGQDPPLQERGTRLRGRIVSARRYGTHRRIRTPTFPNGCDCAARPEAGLAHGNAVKRTRPPGFGGWDSKGKGGFVQSPSLWRAFLPILSARAERIGPRRDGQAAEYHQENPGGSPPRQGETTPHPQNPAERSRPFPTENAGRAGGYDPPLRSDEPERRGITHRPVGNGLDRSAVPRPRRPRFPRSALSPESPKKAGRRAPRFQNPSLF